MWTRLNSLERFSLAVFKTQKDDRDVVATNLRQFVFTLRGIRNMQYAETLVVEFFVFGPP